ncbi:MAG: hypothetical protein MJ171_01465 [Clostridia bacterium]|nr:hypothetical protein [Clostridia bacterium]
MREAWFRKPENIVYVTAEQFADNFGKEVGINNLWEKIEELRANPTEEGIVLRGKNRATIRLFIPNKVFSEPIIMGENVFVFAGEMYPAYCVYELQE